VPSRQPDPAAASGPGLEPPPLALANGLGGFGRRDDVVLLDGEAQTRLPWANVIADPVFGTVATASGSAYTGPGTAARTA